ncbi:MAG: M48 family metallopeptidase [Lachnospiraceae bacterium]|nr:M48 family metallopeptidase [Lachnospiraceae bacterium]
MAAKDYRIIRSRRKTMAIEITSEGEVLVRVPMMMSDAAVAGFVEIRREWIEKHLDRIRKKAAQKAQVPKLTGEEKQALIDKALKIIPEKVRFYAARIGVTYGRITIRNQKTRWGSCSTKGNLNFNYLLADMPEEILDYVVVHELCHRREMNHSPRFWAEVERVLPEYRSARKWLKDKGSLYLAQDP